MDSDGVSVASVITTTAKEGMKTFQQDDADRKLKTNQFAI